MIDPVRSMIDGHAVFTSLRTAPVGLEQVLVVAKLEPRDVDLDPVHVDLPGLDPTGWYLRLRTPNIGPDYLGGPITLTSSSGVVFTRLRCCSRGALAAGRGDAEAGGWRRGAVFTWSR